MLFRSKVWVDNLEKKSKEMETMNQALQQEVVSLRSEVQQLKSILIAHKDCPLIVHQTVGGSSVRGEGRGGEGRGRGRELRTQCTAFLLTTGDRDNPGEGVPMTTEVTLLSQLAAMPSMSPLISSPVPSVGSVVPNIASSHTATPTSIIFTSNGATHATPEVRGGFDLHDDRGSGHHHLGHCSGGIAIAIWDIDTVHCCPVLVLAPSVEPLSGGGAASTGSLMLGLLLVCCALSCLCQ